MNYAIDLSTGKSTLIKRLNKFRIDRGGWNSTPGGWNKSGKKARMNTNFSKRTRVYWKNKLKEELCEPDKIDFKAYVDLC